MHDYYGVPKVFLKKYDYNEEWRNKTLMQKLQRPLDTIEPVTREVASSIADRIIADNPEFKQKLIAIMKSKKWAYKSLHLYSPHIQNEGDYPYEFMTINKTLANSGASMEFEFPLFSIDSNSMPQPISRMSNLAQEFP